jgi:aryl-alcohol dehydrogenase-like predicted oxidoreductase
MNNVLIALVFAIGVGAWVYGKFQKSNGGQSQRSLIGAAVAGGIAFIIFLTLAKSILDRIS